MNILPCAVEGGKALFHGQAIELEGNVTRGSEGQTEIGVRPEHIAFADQGLAARVRKVSDVGRHNVVEAMVGDTSISVITEQQPPNPGDAVHLALDASKTRLYRDGWIASESRGA